MTTLDAVLVPDTLPTKKKRRRSTSPTERSLEWLRKAGYEVSKVEKFVRFPHMGHGVRQDLFGFADLLAVRADRTGVLAVQCGVGSSHADHLAKILEEPKARVWLQAKNEIRIDSWRKVGARGKRKLWEVRQEYVTLDQFPPVDSPLVSVFASDF